MENLYEIKEYLAKLGKLIETSEIENKSIVLFKNKLAELEKSLEQNKYINIMTKKMLVLDNFNFIGYHNTELLPVYKYIGENYAEDVKNIFCGYSEVDVKAKDLIRSTGKLFQIDSNYQVKLRDKLLKFNEEKKEETNVLKLVKSDKPKEKSRILKLSFDNEIEFFQIIKPQMDECMRLLNPLNLYSYINTYDTSDFTINPKYNGVIQFLGYSRIDGFPIIRVFENTFNEVASMKSQINKLFNVDIKDKFNLQVVSALEDHIKNNK
jgi:hypothetical protein